MVTRADEVKSAVVPYNFLRRVLRDKRTPTNSIPTMMFVARASYEI